MGRKKYAQLVEIEQDIEITWDTAAEFMFQLEHGLLLVLKEDRLLTQMQYRYAAQKLKLMWHEQPRKRSEP